MRIKLKYLLPVAQSLVAIFLLHQSQLWIILTRHDDMPGPGAAATLLALINLPVALVRGIWFRSFDVFWSDWIYVIALVVFWYWAGREIESRLDRRTQVAIKSPLVRIAIDLLLTASSVSLIKWGRLDFRWFPWSYFVPSVVFSLLWIFVPPLLLGYDWFSMARRKWRGLQAGNL